MRAVTTCTAGSKSDASAQAGPPPPQATLAPKELAAASTPASGAVAIASVAAKAAQAGEGSPPGAEDSASARPPSSAASVTVPEAALFPHASRAASLAPGHPASASKPRFGTLATGALAARPGAAPAALPSVAVLPMSQEPAPARPPSSTALATVPETVPASPPSGAPSSLLGRPASASEPPGAWATGAEAAWAAPQDGISGASATGSAAAGAAQPSGVVLNMPQRTLSARPPFSAATAKVPATAPLVQPRGAVSPGPGEPTPSLPSCSREGLVPSVNHQSAPGYTQGQREEGVQQPQHQQWGAHFSPPSPPARGYVLPSTPLPANPGPVDQEQPQQPLRQPAEPRQHLVERYAVRRKTASDHEAEVERTMAALRELAQVLSH